MSKTIGVAIATCNGMRYLEQQLDSVLQQTVKPAVISISDDASEDGSVEFLRRFRKRSPIPVFLNLNSNRLGVIENFMIAFGQCGTDYIAYCDQDDVWHEDKLATCSRYIEQSDISLVFHKSATVDHELRPLGRSNPYNVRAGKYAFPHFPDHLWGFGHQMVFSKEVLEVIGKIKGSDVPSVAAIANCFDGALLVAAGLTGNIYFIDKELMEFRRHERSVSPAGKPREFGVGSSSSVDARANKIKDTLATISGLLSDLRDGSAGLALPEIRRVPCLEHLLHLNKRYELRWLVYSASGFAQRISAYCRLLGSNAYGSMLTNKLSPKRLVLDAWRALSGGDLPEVGSDLVTAEGAEKRTVKLNPAQL